MNPFPIKSFKADQADLILLRLRLSGISAQFWLDIDGFFNYSLPAEAAEILPPKSVEINWTRIDEVVSQLANDVSIIYPESAFASWYNQYEEYDALDKLAFANYQAHGLSIANS